jgi:hypothetical protein
LANVYDYNKNHFIFAGHFGMVTTLGGGLKVCPEINYLLAVNFLEMMENSLTNQKILIRRKMYVL